MSGEGTWLHFLDQVRRVAPNGQAFLFYHDANAGSGAFPLSAGTDDALVAAYNRHYSSINPWMPHAAMRPLGRVVQADSMLRRSDLVATEFYNDYLKPQGLETGLGVTIERDGGLNFLFSVLCADMDAAQLEKAKAALQALVPHLRHAFAAYRRAGIGVPAARAESAPASLVRGAGLVRIGPGLRVISAEGDALRLAEAAGLMAVTPLGRFACRSEALLAHVAAVLEAWGSGAVAPPARSFHLFRGDGALPLRVTAFRPTAPADRLYFRGPECVLVVEDPAHGIAPAVDEFGAHYGLTRAERRIVEALVAGIAIEQLAARSGLSRNTLKSQLAQIFAKSGLNRQSDIVRLVCLMAGGYGAATVAESTRGAAAPHGRAAKT